MEKDYYTHYLPKEKTVYELCEAGNKNRGHVNQLKKRHFNTTQLKIMVPVM